METLKLEHLAPYLPFKIIFLDNYGNKRIGTLNHFTYTSTEISIIGVLNESFHGLINKPILHPLSDLTKEIEVNGERFVPLKELGWNYRNDGYVDIFKSGSAEMTLKHWQKLFEWHFNVFDLPEHLWIDINTLNK